MGDNGDMTQPISDLPCDEVNPNSYLVAEYIADDGERTVVTSRERPELVQLAGQLMLTGWEVRRVTR